LDQTLLRILQPPVFDDLDKTRIARLLNTVSLAIFGLLIIVSLVSPFLFLDPGYGVILSGITVLPVLGVLWLVRVGRVHLASQLFVYGIWVLDTILIYGTGGLQSGVTPGYVAVVVLAGLLLGRRSVASLVTLMAAAGLGMVYLQTNSLLPVPVILIDELARWLSLLTNIVLAATVLDLATCGINKALEQTREAERAAAAANDDLKKEVSEHIRTGEEKRQIEATLRESEKKYRSLVENLNVGVFRNSGGMDGKFIHANPAIVDMFGYKCCDELTDVSFIDFCETSSDRERLVNEVVERGFVKDRELSLIKKDGSPFWASCSSSAQFDNKGSILWVDGVIEDITKRKQAGEKLLHDACHDDLTNLPNRMLFYDRLRHSLVRSDREKDSHYAVLFLDLDRFKLVNDSLGLEMGDLLLIQVSRRLASLLRTIDTIARLGGDEFVILLEDINGIGEAIAIADSIQAALKQPFELNDHDVYTTASIGIVYNTKKYKSPENVLRDADTAMYRAKRLGKDRFEVFDPQMRQDVILRMQLETELKRAFDRGEFRVYYQPLISIETDYVIGFEALLRWQHPERGLLSPNEFLQIAEETGLMIPIGRWMFWEVGQVIKKLNTEFPQDPPISVSINLSKRQFTHPGLVPDIKRVLDEIDLDPNCIAMEITEGVIMEDAGEAADKIRSIQALGVKIQMDDFGTGYSSLAALHRFPIGALKIAREFIAEIESSEDRSEIIRTIISLARVMNMSVIVEGVENRGQFDYLKNEDIDIWQGYYCSRPIRPETISEFLTENYS